MIVSLNLATAIGSLFGTVQAKPDTSQSTPQSSAGPTAASAATASASATSPAPAAVATGAAAAAASNPAAAASTSPSAPPVAASAGASAKVAGVASANVGAQVAVAPVDANLVRGAAKPAAAADADVERHFAIGMRESAAQFAADRLSQDGSDPSGAAASLETSEKRFKSLVSQIAVSKIVVSHDGDAASMAATDPASATDGGAGTGASGGAAPSATPDQVHRAYADA